MPVRGFRDLLDISLARCTINRTHDFRRGIFVGLDGFRLMISTWPICSRMTLCDPGARAPVGVIPNAKLFSIGGANSRWARIELRLPLSGGDIYSTF